MNKDKTVYNSALCIDGKRIHTMREIAKAAFGESFLYIEIKDGRYIIRVEHNIDIPTLNRFKEKYKLCKVKIYKEVTDLSQLSK